MVVSQGLPVSEMFLEVEVQLEGEQTVPILLLKLKHKDITRYP